MRLADIERVSLLQEIRPGPRDAPRHDPRVQSGVEQVSDFLRGRLQSQELVRIRHVLLDCGLGALRGFGRSRDGAGAQIVKYT